MRHSGFGIHIGSIFVGCIVYADDIALLSSSCYGMQKLIEICSQYGTKWDIKFNSAKSQLITFGGGTPKNCEIRLDGMPIGWVEKVKYLGVYFMSNSCYNYIGSAVGKFYGQFNNIMSVIGAGRYELSALHLTKAYCLPSLLYGCEVWSLTSDNVHKVNVAWNNSLRHIFNCCWRESVKPLQFFCKSLPMSYEVDQRKIIFWKKMYYAGNVLLYKLASMSKDYIMSICSKYNICHLAMSDTSIKDCIWLSFIQTVHFD